MRICDNFCHAYRNMYGCNGYLNHRCSGCGSYDYLYVTYCDICGEEIQDVSEINLDDERDICDACRTAKISVA